MKIVDARPRVAGPLCRYLDVASWKLLPEDARQWYAYAGAEAGVEESFSPMPCHGFL